MGADEDAKDAEDARSFVALTLEASIPASGRRHGLTADEIGTVAVRLSKPKRAVLAAADDMLREGRISLSPEGRLRLLPGDWRFTIFENGSLNPEWRWPQYLDPLVQILRDRSESEKPPVGRDELIRIATTPPWQGYPFPVDVGIEVLLLASWIVDRDGLVIADSHSEGPLPNALIARGQPPPWDPERARMLVDLFGVVGAVVNGRPDATAPNDAVAAEGERPVTTPKAGEQTRAFNAEARRLLAYLYECHAKVNGAFFTIRPDAETVREIRLADQAAYMRAANRLIGRHFAAWHNDKFGALTITPAGARAAEDPAQIEDELPVASEESSPMPTTSSVVPDKKRIFVIHGRHEPARNEMGIFLRSMGLEPLWFRDVRKTMGGTVQIVKVVERGMDLAQGVLALFTPEEFATLHPKLQKPGETGEAVTRWQGRPNVLFEAGMAYGRDPDRVALVLFGDAELFTDASGMHVFWPTNDHGPDSSRAMLRGVLAGGMRCAVNMHSDDWMTAGDFDAVVRGLSGVSPLDPFRRSDEVTAAPVQLPAAHPPAQPVPPDMHDDKAEVLLTRWLEKAADQGRRGEESEPMFSAAEIGRAAGVPENKVSLLVRAVATKNPHFGVTINLLQGGDFHLKIGAPRVRQTR